MSDFECAVNFVLRNEGELNTNPHDLGKTTKYGISLRFLKSILPENLKKYSIFDFDITDETIINLTMAQAKLIYKGEFWDHAPFEKIMNQEHCNYIFDMAINLGIANAIKRVQRACWAVMRKWDNYLADDGILGDATIAVINNCGYLLMPALRAERANHYRSIIQKYPEQEEFKHGWFNRTYCTG